jgi:hypothetical protein
VIVSAYNRPKIVQYAMRSVLASRFADLELIVIGDGCNAETEAAILQVSDSRTRFENLSRNTGHQSSPHNRGVELARGEFVFFLNQDDLYFADHIGERILFMRETGAELAWSPVILLQASGKSSGLPDPETDRLILDGAVPDAKFDPRSFIISSSWSARREACRQVGNWLQPSQTYLSPSQEWLFRAWRAGKRMAYHPHPSVLCIHSGMRRYSYVDQRSVEHERAWSWLQGGESARRRVMDCVAVDQAAGNARLARRVTRLEQPVKWRLTQLLLRKGVHPDAFDRMLKGVGKGGSVRSHAKFTKEPPRLAPGARIAMGRRDAEGYLGEGWGQASGASRISLGSASQVFFTLENEALANGAAIIELGVTGPRFPLRISASIDQCEPAEFLLGPRQQVIALRTDRPGAHSIALQPVLSGQPPIGRMPNYINFALDWISALRDAPAPSGGGGDATAADRNDRLPARSA